MKPTQGTRFVMGTFLNVAVSGGEASARMNFLDDIQRLEDLLSLYKPTSDISKINRAAGRSPVPVHPDTFRIVQESLRWAERTGGAFDPTVQPLTHLWGFDGFETRRPESSEEDTARRQIGFANVLLNEEALTVFLRYEGMGLDLGGIGKGYALDRALEIVTRDPAVKTVRADFGGQLLFWDRSGRFAEETIAIEESNETFKISSNASVSTSSNRERFDPQSGAGHLMDPRSGKPSSRSTSVTVVAETATMAEALSTAIFVMGDEERVELLWQFPEVRVFGLRFPTSASVPAVL